LHLKIELSIGLEAGPLAAAPEFCGALGRTADNPQGLVACGGLSLRRILGDDRQIPREHLWRFDTRASAHRAKEARKEADRLACEAWNKRMLGFRGPAQPSPTIGDALNAGYSYLEVRCLGCDTHHIVRRPKTTPIHELERYMRCKDCSQVRGYPYKRSHLIAMRSTKILANHPASTWWPGQR
jgi:hypothetical protein